MGVLVFRFHLFRYTAHRFGWRPWGRGKGGRVAWRRRSVLLNGETEGFDLKTVKAWRGLIHTRRGWIRLWTVAWKMERKRRLHECGNLRGALGRHLADAIHPQHGSHATFIIFITPYLNQRHVPSLSLIHLFGLFAWKNKPDFRCIPPLVFTYIL